MMMTPTLFMPEISPLTAIGGLSYVPDYLSLAEHDTLLHHIDAHPWRADLKRRVQHYGYRYDYRAKRVDSSADLGALPEWVMALNIRLFLEGVTEQLADQVIVNEYLPGQGIARHIDCETCFSDTVVSLSLGSPCVMVFNHGQTREEIPLLLEPGSLLVMKDEARYAWKHGIPARQVDRINGHTLVRGRRVSVTLRKIIR